MAEKTTEQIKRRLKGGWRITERIRVKGKVRLQMVSPKGRPETVTEVRG